jgi:DNA topoisomerase-1
MLFPEVYKSKGFKLNNQKLTDAQEERIWALARYLESEHFTNPVFEKNFLNDFNKDFTFNIKSFKELVPVLKEMRKIQLNEQEAKKNKTKEERLKEKEEKEKLKEKYGYALVDGVKTQLSTYTTEGSRIFIGRGAHPKHGCWIDAVQPEDITINCSPGKEPAPPKGHKWGKVVFNQKAAKTFYYNLEKISANKFAYFAPSSDFGKKKNSEKFDKILLLANNWDKMKKHIDKEMKSNDEKIREAAMVAWLISNVGIRPGSDEKIDSEDFAETIGASTLKKKNILLNEKEDSFVLDFIGKDSVRFTRKIEATGPVLNYFKQIYKTLKDEDLIFPNITAGDVNKFLGDCLPGVTCKAFRGAKGSALMAEGLRNIKIEEGMTKKDIKRLLDDANFRVAELLNHKRTVNKQKFSESLSKIDSKKEQVQAEIRVLEKMRKDIGEEKYQKKLDRLNKRIEEFETQKKLKDKFSETSISTSRTNYIDCRVIISWLKDNDLEPEVAYTKTVLAKFDWALDCNKNFYKKYPKIEA